MATYELGRVIGHGGMATVHEGHKIMPDGERYPVAIKRIHAHLAQDPDLIRFLCREGAVCMQVSNGHPNLVSVFEIDRDAQGQLFLVMEWVDGVTLQDLLNANLLTPPLIRRITHDVLHALGHVHAHGVVHRDISPCNILISREGDIKLSDFGLATSSDTGQSIVPGFKGKAAYASPESIQVQQVGPSSDLFSLAAMVYQLLTGTLPFGRGTVAQIHRRMSIWQFDPLSASEPEDLGQFVNGQLRYRPRERAFADADQAIVMLQEHGGDMASDEEVGLAVERALDARPMQGILQSAGQAGQQEVAVRASQPGPLDTLVAPARVNDCPERDVLGTTDSPPRPVALDRSGWNIARCTGSSRTGRTGRTGDTGPSNRGPAARDSREDTGSGGRIPTERFSGPGHRLPATRHESRPVRRSWLTSLISAAMIIGLYSSLWVILWPRTPTSHSIAADPVVKAADPVAREAVTADVVKALDTTTARTVAPAKPPPSTATAPDPSPRPFHSTTRPRERTMQSSPPARSRSMARSRSSARSRSRARSRSMARQPTEETNQTAVSDAPPPASADAIPDDRSGPGTSGTRPGGRTRLARRPRSSPGSSKLSGPARPGRSTSGSLYNVPEPYQLIVSPPLHPDQRWRDNEVRRVVSR